MEKMTVRAGVARGYGFLIRRFFHILGLAWLPVAILAAGAVLMAPQFFAAGARIAQSGLSLGLWRDEIALLALMVAGLALFAVFAVSLSRLALGLQPNRYLAHFTFGAREARFFLACLRLILIVAGVVLAVGIAAYVIAWAVAATGLVTLPLDGNGMPAMREFQASPRLRLFVSAVDVIGVFAAIYTALRLGFFLGPIAAAEDHASLKRSWELSAGQFWRMLAVTLIIALPLWFVALAAYYFALGADSRPFYVFDVSPEQRLQAFTDMANVVAAHAPLFVVLKAVSYLLFSSLLLGAAASAYPGAGPEKKSTLREPQPEPEEELPPVIVPVAATTMAAAAEPSIERSLLEQFGDHVHHHAPAEAAHEDLPPVESHVVAAQPEEKPVPMPTRYTQRAAPPDDILELEAIHEIRDPTPAPPSEQKEEEHTLFAHAPLD